MKRFILLLSALFLAACAAPNPTSEPELSEYPDLGPAPELAGDTWLNAAAPLRLADLAGKVVLVDMWTFG
jgi:hypothetical protein